MRIRTDEDYMSRGSVKKQKRAGANSWTVRIFLGRDSKTHKRRYVNYTVEGTRKTAEQFKTARLREIDQGTYVEPTRLTLSEYLDQWLISVAGRLKECTAIDYAEKMRIYVRPAIGSRRLDALQPIELQKLYSDMLCRGLSPRTVRYAHSILSAAFKEAVDLRIIARNPVERLKLPKQVRREMQALSPEQAVKFIEASQGTRYGVVFVFALVTGMRPEEYLALRWSDVDLQKATATVQRTISWRAVDAKYKYGETKTAGSRRIIDLPAFLIKDLMKHKADQWQKKGKDNYKDQDLVFVNRVGDPINRRDLGHYYFKPLLKKAGLPDMPLYSLRHSCATLLLAEGEYVKVVSERLGHASSKMTLDNYSHVLPGMQRAASDRMERLLKRG